MRNTFLSLIFLFVSLSAQAQELQVARLESTDTLPKVISPIQKSDIPLPSPEPTSTALTPGGNINWTKFGISTGFLSGSIIGLHILQANSWWANNRGSFHIYDDPIYKANFDKYGHAFAPYMYAHYFDELYSWSGFDSAQSTLLATISAAMYEFYVEIEDGYGKDWGFSPGDATADLIGSAFYLLRNRVDVLRNFNYKWFYYPSQQYLHGAADIQGQSLNPIDDYGGQTYWITMDVHRMLGEDAKKYWPEWINLTLGFGGYNIGDFAISTQTDIPEPKIAYYLGLDFELEKIIPKTNIGVIDFLIRGLNYWHLPAPAVRLSPDPRFFILFPFRMTIG